MSEKCAVCGFARSCHDAYGWRWDGTSFPGGHKFQDEPAPAKTKTKRCEQAVVSRETERA